MYPMAHSQNAALPCILTSLTDTAQRAKGNQNAVKIQTAMSSEDSVALFVARSDAEYVLEPIVDALLAHGLTKDQILEKLAVSVKRAMRLSVDDNSDLKLSVTEWDAEALPVADKLVARLTVTDALANFVPPVAQRRGLPAAVAAFAVSTAA
jgi:hypothetical protein